jgi:hypothetical protein
MPMATVYIETTVIIYHVATPSRDSIVAAHQQLPRTGWEQALPSSGSTRHRSSSRISHAGIGRDAARARPVAEFSVIGCPREVDGRRSVVLLRDRDQEKARIDFLHLP